MKIAKELRIEEILKFNPLLTFGEAIKEVETDYENDADFAFKNGEYNNEGMRKAIKNGNKRIQRRREKGRNNGYRRKDEQSFIKPN